MLSFLDDVRSNKTPNLNPNPNPESSQEGKLHLAKYGDRKTMVAPPCQWSIYLV